MSIQLPQALEQSAEHIFYNIPQQIEIDEELKTNYSRPSQGTIDKLIQELKEKGPMIGLGKYGPQAYRKPPGKIAKSLSIANQEMYGWPPGSRKEEAASLYILILGAKKTENQAHVYFTLSEDCTTSTDSFIRLHRPPKQDATIYVISHESFRQYLTDLYLQNSPSKTFKAENLSKKDYIDKLCAFPLNSILDRGEEEAKCKAIGQAIFDQYKRAGKGDSFAGKQAAQDICEATQSHAKDGRLRKQYIEHAWDGIGDSNWTWIS